MSTKGTSAGNAVSGRPPRSATPKAAQLIVADLSRQIIRGELKGDDSLPSENELMRLYGVSRPTLREALRVLEFEGLLTVRRGAKGGSTIHNPNGQAAARSMGLVLEHRGATLADVLQARSTIEPACARLVAERGKKLHVRRLTSNLETSGPSRSADAQSNGFHELLVELAGNETLKLMYGMLRIVLGDSTTGLDLVGCAKTRSLSERRRAHDAHQHLIGLIEKKDGDQAEEFWTEHLRAGQAIRKPTLPLNFSA